MYNYNAKVLRVIDGDTIEVLVDLGFYVHKEVRIRLKDIDTHEIYGVKKESEEYQKGMESKRFVEEQCPVGSIVKISSYKADKYHKRWDADITYNKDGNSLNLTKELIRMGYNK